MQINEHKLRVGETVNPSAHSRLYRKRPVQIYAGVKVCVNGVWRWTGIPSGVNSPISRPVVPWTVSAPWEGCRRIFKLNINTSQGLLYISCSNTAKIYGQFRRQTVYDCVLKYLLLMTLQKKNASPDACATWAPKHTVLFGSVTHIWLHF